jgi:Coproporphyrinogen III oxidase and related Fe-S oxidoreductases
LKAYYREVEQRGNALWRGLTLSDDDCLRRDVIKALICNFSLDFSAIEAQWPIDFDDYFAEDLALLAPLMADGLLEQQGRSLQVTGIGRLLIRNICMCFDRYLRQKARLQQFSRVI